MQHNKMKRNTAAEVMRSMLTRLPVRSPWLGCDGRTCFGLGVDSFILFLVSLQGVFVDTRPQEERIRMQSSITLPSSALVLVNAFTMLRSSQKVLGLSEIHFETDVQVTALLGQLRVYLFNSDVDHKCTLHDMMLARSYEAEDYVGHDGCHVWPHDAALKVCI